MGVDPVSIGFEIAAAVAAVSGALVTAHGQQQELKGKQALSALQSQTDRLNQVRQARIRMAQIEQMGVNQGAGESSSVTTGTSGVQGQAESNIQSIGAQQGLINNIFSAQQTITTGNAIGQVGGALRAGAEISSQINSNKPVKPGFADGQ